MHLQKVTLCDARKVRDRPIHEDVVASFDDGKGAFDAIDGAEEDRVQEPPPHGP